MYSKKQFTALEAMCREQAALARNEMEYSQMKYWLAEAEEWKQLRQSDAIRPPRLDVPRPETMGVRLLSSRLEKRE
jgi:hypothetical protein